MRKSDFDDIADKEKSYRGEWLGIWRATAGNASVVECGAWRAPSDARSRVRIGVASQRGAGLIRSLGSSDVGKPFAANDGLWRVLGVAFVLPTHAAECEFTSATAGDDLPMHAGLTKTNGASNIHTAYTFLHTLFTARSVYRFARFG